VFNPRTICQFPTKALPETFGLQSANNAVLVTVSRSWRINVERHWGNSHPRQTGSMMIAATRSACASVRNRFLQTGGIASSTVIRTG